MPRQRSPNRDKAFEIYKENDGNIDLVKIAEILNLSPGTIRGWKNKDKWDSKLNGTLQKNTERSKRKKGAQPKNKNSKGHVSSVPKGNKNAETHGFFSKYLPEDTLDIIQEIKKKDPLDILWENINIQYAAIIRAQRIMYVKDKKDLTKVLKKERRSSGETSESWEEQYELQFAWDKQATLLQAQSRAMSELRGLIKQYEEILHNNWNLATDEQKLRCEKLKTEIEKSRGEKDNNDSDDVLKDMMEGLRDE